MSFAKQLAKNLREVHFGGNWTAVSLKEALQGITWRQATAKVYELNTIAALVFHINYYVHAVLKVLQGEPLDSNDKFSFNVPMVDSEEGWQELVSRVMAEAAVFADEIEKLDDTVLEKQFIAPEYGNYFRNLAGITEHCHYHTGQIVLIKKILERMPDA